MNSRVDGRVLVLLLLSVVMACVVSAHAFADSDTQTHALEDGGTATDVLEQRPVLSLSAGGEIDLSTLPTDELLTLRQLIESELVARGYVPYFDIERGASGEAVLSIQERLTELGFYSGRLTGKMDSQTQVAFKLFEKANGLENDGLPSIEDQTILFGKEVVGVAIEIVETPGEEATSPSEAEEVLAEYEPYDYTEYARYPEMHLGDQVCLTGKVVQVIGERGTWSYRVRLATSGSSDVVMVRIPTDPGYNVLDGDRLTVYGSAAGLYTYESVLGSSVTIPSVSADEIVLH